ncbi:MAG: DUF2917 domain-containing protein [Candidatus Accumulibacter sp.]|uniref:DUF2917 domain-containing protein n=1 Tax=Accumulibacter sp. TaxID=2053492 RepID=UPI0025D3D6C7|nr:DUF2917 domain-containing protein [Accumulibacter sp.]MCM8598863.1 DUF2917 domain-containing protein [Accumulibacter sp.]MCM8663527.1 DUF2917 domain-containing protein [Accumulibacter sp.]
MDIDLKQSELCLAHNVPIRLPAARGLRVTCTAGIVWLTVAGEAGDILLQPGDSHLICGRGLALLEAIGSGRVRLEKACRPASATVRARLQRIFVRLAELARPYRSLPWQACSGEARA